MSRIENEIKSLCKEIGNFFGEYFEEDGMLCIDNGDIISRYNTPNELLADWVDTLIESHCGNQSYGTPDCNWEKEVLFIYTYVIGKHPVGLRKINQKNGAAWQVAVDITNPNYPHGKNAFLGTYDSIIEAIRTRREYLTEDLADIDTATPEGIEAALAKAKLRRLRSKEERRSADKRAMNYAVVFTYSFDGEVAVYLFADEDSAKAFLRTNFETEVKVDIEENGYDTESFISPDGWYAKIINHFDDHDDVTEYRIGTIYR